MDTDAARRARRIAIKADLAQAYTDEEASPPEWVDLLGRISDEKRAISEDLELEVARFTAEPDIRIALARRDRVNEKTRERIAALNQRISRLNLIVPNSRFTRATLDPDEVLRPLFRAARSTAD